MEEKDSNKNIKTMNDDYSGKKIFNSSLVLNKIALTALLTAVAFVLGGIGSAIGIFDPWTMGGSVALSSLPLVFIGLICGWQYALVGGLAYAGIDILMDNGYVYANNFIWLSILLDYICGFGFCFVAGFFRKPFLKHQWWSFFVAMILTMVLRFFSSFISGAVAFGTYVPEDFFSRSIWVYSLVYNSGYIGISLILDLIIGGLLIKPIWKAVDHSPLALPTQK